MIIKKEYLEIITDYVTKQEESKGIKVLIAFLGGNISAGLPEFDENLTFHYVYTKKGLPKKQRRKRFEVNGLDIYANGYSELYFSEAIFRMDFQEIAHSPVVYIGDIEYCKRLSVLADKAFQEAKALSLYWSKSQAKKCKCIIDRIKKRLYCKWIYEYHTMPPMDFYKLVKMTVDDESLKSSILEIANGKESKQEKKTVISYLEDIKAPNKNLKVSQTELECELNLLAIDMIKKYRQYIDQDDKEEENDEAQEISNGPIDFHRHTGKRL